MAAKCECDDSGLDCECDGFVRIHAGAPREMLCTGGGYRMIRIQGLLEIKDAHRPRALQ